MSNLLSHDFGSEDEDDDFNPVVADDSDAENSKVSSFHPTDDGSERDADKTYNEQPVKTVRISEDAANDDDEDEAQNGDDDDEGAEENGDDDDEEGEEEEEEAVVSTLTRRHIYECFP